MKTIIGLITLVFFWKFAEKRVVETEGDFFVLPIIRQRFGMATITKIKRLEVPLVTLIGYVVHQISKDPYPFFPDMPDLSHLIDPKMTRFPLRSSHRGRIPVGNQSTHPYAKFFR
jgi:hypothetical protein